LNMQDTSPGEFILGGGGYNCRHHQMKHVREQGW